MRRTISLVKTGQSGDIKETIICITNSAWDGPKRARHNLMREYARRGHRVFFVEASITWLKLLRNTDSWKQLSLVFKAERTVEDGVIAIMMPPFLPGGEWVRVITVLNWLVVRLWLKATIYRHFRVKSPRLFLFSPTAYPLVGKFGEEVSIYFCNDPFVAMFRYPSARKNLEWMENELTRSVDVVFAVSDKLVEDRKLHNSNTFLIPHGVDDQLFGRALDPATIIPKDLAACPKPIFGHIGVLNDRIDVPFVRSIAGLMPESSFVFIGPIVELSNEYRQQLLSLKEFPNIFFLGDKRDEDLPSYLSGIDVCFIPYNQTEIMHYIRANAKFYQFVAAGRPIVSTIKVRGLDTEIVIAAHTPEAFVSSLKEAFKLRSPSHIEKRKGISRQNTHGARLDEMERILAMIPIKNRPL